MEKRGTIALSIAFGTVPIGSLLVESTVLGH